MPPERLVRVRVQNYKSIAAAVVDLGALTVLVGPNGAGKSNFVDALRFVRDCLQDTVGQALRYRGNIGAVRRHSRGHPTNFGFRLVMDLGRDVRAEYAFAVKAEPESRFTVKREHCVVRKFLAREVGFEVEAGAFTAPALGVLDRIEPDSLALPLLSATPDFRPVYEFLTKMRFYSISPDRIRELQEPDAGMVLNADGSNTAAVLREISRHSPGTYERLCRLLSKVVPGTSRAEYRGIGPKETIRFKQDVGDTALWNFDALNMSDGTLRALGILLAVYQVSKPSLVVIEEPEATIHPAALDVMMDILRAGGERTQLLLTTHSPDILDHKAIDDDDIRFVKAEKGVTSIAPLAEVTRDTIREHLYTAGELLAMGELRPDDEGATSLEGQLPLFGATRFRDRL